MPTEAIVSIQSKLASEFASSNGGLGALSKLTRKKAVHTAA